jgi:hypothetical protein
MARSPLPAAAALLSVALLTAGARAGAEPYRDGLPAPSYWLLASMLDQVAQGSGTEGMERPLQMLAPLLDALGLRYAVPIRQRLEGAVAGHDAAAAARALVTLSLVDAEDLLREVRRDDLSGWDEAKVAARKARLDYALVAARLELRQRALHLRVLASFDRLLARLQAADLTTDPAAVDLVAAGLRADLAQLRAAAERGPVR